MKTLEVDELSERLKEILRKVEEEGETFEVSDHGKVIARVVPAKETKQAVEEDDRAVWAELDRLSAEISAHWPPNVSAVEAVRDARRDL